MPLVDLNGAFGLHIHSHPSLFLRGGTEKRISREKIDRMTKEDPARPLKL